jgi:EF hand
MFIPVGLALGALSGISSLVQSAASSLTKGNGDNPLSALTQGLGGDQPPAIPTGTSSASQLDSGTLAALISLQGQASSGTSGASGVFAKLDANSDESISQREFENGLSAAGVDTNSADALFKSLDANGDGSISKSELASARHAYQGHHQHHRAGGAGQGGASSLLNATSADGSTSQTTTNPDGSTTTTITYGDGSTVSSTIPAAQSGGSVSPGHSNRLEQLIRMQSMLSSQSAPTTAAIA